MAKTKIAFLLIFTLNFSCSYRHEKQSSLTEGTQGIEIPVNVSYQMVADKVFTPSCIPCHGNSGNVNLETYSSVFGNIERIRQVALVTKRMPRAPFPPLTREQLAFLSSWIQAGAPETTNGIVSVKRIETLAPTFKSIKNNILRHKCLVCHSQGQSAENVSLESSDDLIKSHRNLVVPGEPEESTLLHSIMPDAENQMPPAQSFIENLDDEEIEIIKKWIENGAKD